MICELPELGNFFDVGGDGVGGVEHPWLQLRFQGIGWVMLPSAEILGTVGVCGHESMFILGCTDIAEPLRNFHGMFHLSSIGGWR